MFKYFQLSRGVQQGCPLSYYIFILCAELIDIAVRLNDNIRGIQIGDQSHVKITQFADDSTHILDGSKESIVNAVKVMEKFGLISGLKLNVAKSVLFKIGSLKDNERDIAPDKNYQYTKDPVKFLEIIILMTKNELFKHNFETTVLDIWSQRDLTPIGKITICKSLALSQMTYLFSVLPSPSNEFIKRLQHV